jgi:HAD superfamily hydrolase (TIGR01450 family)
MISPTFDGLVCDLDGVIYRGDVAIPGAAQAVERLRAAGVDVLFCTNNSRSTVVQYVSKLGSLGIEARPERILTSAVVTAEVLEQQGFAGKTAIVVGGDGIKQALSDVCISVKTDPAVTVSDLVVVGWDPGFTYEAMKRASTAVRRGAKLVATNGDASFPAADGLWPGAGAILASIETASGAKAEIMGKPHEPMMRVAQARLAGARSIACVGDRPDTDLAGARAKGWTTILVLSGVTDEATARGLDPQPDLVLGSIAELTQ